ncbi:MAG TPA: proline iminopeptidase-family hydrolase, partial [Saprospiraceae bacterium]|nr:proline iminopeptidase-family hydrolase [Saprospiraceae bacterium]
KVLTLHGGPGATHEYFECIQSFFPREGIEFFYYDQLGSGNSDNPQGQSEALWQLPRFVDELEQVRVALGLDSNNFILLGHSWGGILAMEYALKYQQNLKGLIISDMMSSAPEYDKYSEVLAQKLDPDVLKELRTIEANNDFDNPRYMELLTPNFYNQFICRIPLDQWPEPVNRSFSKMNPEVYVSMQGPSEFGISGRLENWDVSKRLPEIKVPTLTVGATYDTMDPEYMRWMSTQVQNGKFLLCPNGSHMCMWDDQDVWMKGVMDFVLSLN